LRKHLNLNFWWYFKVPQANYLWAKSAALAVAKRSYHPYLPPKKVSKNPQLYCIHCTLPKNAKNHFSCLRFLGVNFHEIWSKEFPYEKITHKMKKKPPIFECYNLVDPMELWVVTF
jgi:hypothetical protein